MKVDIETIRVDQELTTEIDFNDYAINKLRIKESKRKDIKFKNIKVSYLKGLRLRYSPLTQKKVFYLRYKFKGKASWLKLNEFIYGHYGTLEVTEELLGLYKKYYPSSYLRQNILFLLLSPTNFEQD